MRANGSLTFSFIFELHFLPFETLKKKIFFFFCWHSEDPNFKHVVSQLSDSLRSCQPRTKFGCGDDLFLWPVPNSRWDRAAQYLSDSGASDRSTAFPQVSQLKSLPSVIWMYEDMASLNPSLTRELSDTVLFLLKMTDLEVTKEHF